MSTILIHKENELKETLNQKTSRGIENKMHQAPNIKWQDFAGLSWILLDGEDY